MAISEMLISEAESITVQGKRKDIFEKALSLVFDASFLKQNMTVTGYLEMNNTLYFTRYKKESIPGNAILSPLG